MSLSLSLSLGPLLVEVTVTDGIIELSVSGIGKGKPEGKEGAEPLRVACGTR